MTVWFGLSKVFVGKTVVEMQDGGEMGFRGTVFYSRLPGKRAKCHPTCAHRVHLVGLQEITLKDPPGSSREHTCEAGREARLGRGGGGL
jgi:hypothetical protein